MFAGQRQRGRPGCQRQAGSLSYFGQARVLFARGFGNHRKRFRRVRRGDHRHAGLDDAGLFRRDFRARVAEPFLMV